MRFLYSPSLALGEGLGLAAEEIVFAGDDAQAWLTEHVFPEFVPEFTSDPGTRRFDLATVHRARNVLWGVWGNAALLAAEGRSEDEIGEYLARWALYDDTELAAVVPMTRPSPMSAYFLGYFRGWEVVRPLVRDRDAVKRPLTQHLLPSDLTP